MWTAGHGSSSLLDNAFEQNVYWEVFGVMAATITQAPSLNASGLRAHLLSLQGQSNVILQINIDPATGLQVGSSNEVQINREALAITGGLMEYPFDWSWHPLAYGDEVSDSFNSAIGPIVPVVAVVGVWVAFIVIEQALFVKRKGDRWHLWLIVAATSLGGISMWCSMLLRVAGVYVTGDACTIDMTFSLGAAFVGLVPALLMPYAGLCVLIGDTQTKASEPSAARAEGGTEAVGGTQLARAPAPPRPLHQRARRCRRAAGGLGVPHHARGAELHVADGGDAVAIGRHVAGDHRTGRGAGDAFDVHCLPWAQVARVRAVPVRCGGDRRLHGAAGQPAVDVLGGGCRPPVRLPVHRRRPCDGTAAGRRDGRRHPLLFVGVHFSRMQLSRSSLTTLVASLEHRSSEQTAEIAQCRGQLDALSRMLDYIALNSPLPTDYAAALSAASTYSSFETAVITAWRASQRGSGRRQWPSRCSR